MSTLVLVDFDHTLYQKDSLLEFTKDYLGKRRFYWGLVQLIPDILIWKLGFISNEQAKTEYFHLFFKNENYNTFLEKSRLFAQNKVPQHLDEVLLQKVKNHLLQNDLVYIVTASPAEWIKPWADQLKIKVIGTQIEQHNELLTGNFSSKNCYGIEKVNRIKNEINLDLFDSICVYGKGKGDREMLQLRK